MLSETAPSQVAPLNREVVLSVDAAGLIAWADECAHELLGARSGLPFADLTTRGSERRAARFLRAARGGPTDGWTLTCPGRGTPRTLVFRGQPHQAGALVVGSLLPPEHRGDGAPCAADPAARQHRVARRQRELDRARAELRRARAETEAAERRLAFLAEANRLLAADPDHLAALRGIARLAVPALADCCALDLLAEDGSLRRLELAQPPPAGAGREHGPAHRCPADAAAAAVRVLRAGRPLLLADITLDSLRAIGGAAEPPCPPCAPGLRGLICVPLLARGRSLGALTLCAAGERSFGPADLALAEVLAGRCAEALDNAALSRDAQAAIRTRDEFLSIASHELRTPVTGIKGYLQILRRADERGDLDPARLSRALHSMGGAADRLAELTQELLDVSCIRLGRLALHAGPLDLRALAEEVVGRYAERLADRRHSLTLAADERLPRVEGDAHRLEQVLANLLDNALTFSPCGGEIRLTLRAEGAGVRLTLSDAGIGLPPGAAEEIFQPFGRAANATRQHLPGIGLGLYICRDIVERHGGRIQAASDGEDRGTTVSVWLPAI